MATRDNVDFADPEYSEEMKVWNGNGIRWKISSLEGSVKMNLDAQSQLIRKKIIHTGQPSIPEYLPGSKVTFHFTTRIITYDSEGKAVLGDVMDDSRKHPQPMELLIGKQFKLEVWESILRTMSVAEVAEFYVHSSLCLPYPIVAKTLRDAYLKKKHDEDHVPTPHCCGAMALSGNSPKLGYEDLNNLMDKPSDLLFTLELLSFDPPESYTKEPWQMNESEKLEALPKLKEQGNQLYKDGKIGDAAKAYSQGLGIIEQLLLREKPGDEEWTQLDSKKIPFLLNYSQCQLILGNYYDVIEQCSQVLQRQPENVKALYRRGLAHVKVWNPTEAENDLKRVIDLDSSLKTAVKTELSKLEEVRKHKNQSDAVWLQKAFG
nr:EOG090X09NR [Sida crystallina]